jgi:hypothetical protein
MRRLVCVPGTLAAAIGGRSTSLDAMIAKTFFIVKIFRAQSTNYLRREKSIRDHGAERRSEV